MGPIGQGRKSGIGRPDNSRNGSRKLVTGNIWKSADEKKVLDIGVPAKLSQKTKRELDFGNRLKSLHKPQNRPKKLIVQTLRIGGISK
jgi:hypothetical protein